MDISMTAKTKSAAEFFACYVPGDEQKLFDGRSLLYYALSNSDLFARYEISNFLLDKGVDTLRKNSEDETVLHVLLGQVKHDLDKTIVLCRRLISTGVDINALDKKQRLALQWIINLKYIDDDLLPLYEIWFSQQSVDIFSKNRFGFSPIDLAIKFGRSILVERMKDYAKL